jgi:hypothetical protein
MIKKLLFPALVGAMTMFAACESDPCADLEGKCGSGSCFEGTCVCDQGYEADAAGVCNVEWSAKFVGEYIGRDTSVSDNPDFSGVFELPPTDPCEIRRVSESQVSIINLGYFGAQFTANVSKLNASDESALLIEFVDVLDNNNDKWSGSLRYDPVTKKLSGTYRLIDYKDASGGFWTVDSKFVYTKNN